MSGSAYITSSWVRRSTVVEGGSAQKKKEEKKLNRFTVPRSVLIGSAHELLGDDNSNDFPSHHLVSKMLNLNKWACDGFTINDVSLSLVALCCIAIFGDAGLLEI